MAESGRRQLLIQIDGLSRPAFERLMAHGATPTLKRILKRNKTTLVSIYSGVPSTTAVAQAELFYGVCHAVPAFAFRESHKTLRRMLEPAAAALVQRKLEECDPGLLVSGSAYGNMYTGGAGTSRFCPAAMGRPLSLLALGPRASFRSWFTYSIAVLRSLGMLAGELGRLALGKYRVHTDFHQQFKDALSRIVGSVVVRDSIVAAARRDLRAGVPVVQLNFFGYDKQSHRYGPESVPAKHALKGIDSAIGYLISTARKAKGRFTIVIYSDHGQDRVAPFRTLAGPSIEQVVEAAAREAGFASGASGPDSNVNAAPTTLSVVQSGALAHVYIDGASDLPKLHALAQGIARSAEHVGVLTKGENGKPMLFAGAGTPVGVQELTKTVLKDHPYAEHVRDDLEKLCDHPDCGDMVLIGTGLGTRSVSFAPERGSHGGPSPLETHAFAIVPQSLTLRAGTKKNPLRFNDLRLALIADREPSATP